MLIIFYCFNWISNFWNITQPLITRFKLCELQWKNLHLGIYHEYTYTTYFIFPAIVKQPLYAWTTILVKSSPIMKRIKRIVSFIDSELNCFCGTKPKIFFYYKIYSLKFFSQILILLILCSTTTILHNPSAITRKKNK